MNAAKLVFKVIWSGSLISAGSTTAEDSCQTCKSTIYRMLISQKVLWDFKFFQRGKSNHFSCDDAKETS